MLECRKGVILNGKRFAFRQNEYVLRTSGILEVVHRMENKMKGTNELMETIISLIGIVVTIISIIVTIISIIKTGNDND